MSETIVVNIPDKQPEESPAVEALQETVETLTGTVQDLAEKVEGEEAPEPPAGDDTALAVTVGALAEKVGNLESEVQGLRSALEAAIAEEPEPEPEPVPVELPPVPEEPPKPPTFFERCGDFIRNLID